MESMKNKYTKFSQHVP